MGIGHPTFPQPRSVTSSSPIVFMTMAGLAAVAIVNIKVIHWPSKTDPLGGADVFLDLTTRLGQDFVDILSGS